MVFNHNCTLFMCTYNNIYNLRITANSGILSSPGNLFFPINNLLRKHSHNSVCFSRDLVWYLMCYITVTLCRKLACFPIISLTSGSQCSPDLEVLKNSRFESRHFWIDHSPNSNISINRRKSILKFPQNGQKRGIKVPIRKTADNSGSGPYLFHYPFKRIIRSQATTMFSWKTIIT